MVLKNTTAAISGLNGRLVTDSHDLNSQVKVILSKIYIETMKVQTKIASLDQAAPQGYKAVLNRSGVECSRINHVACSISAQSTVAIGKVNQLAHSTESNYELVSYVSFFQTLLAEANQCLASVASAFQSVEQIEGFMGSLSTAASTEEESIKVTESPANAPQDSSVAKAEATSYIKKGFESCVKVLAHPLSSIIRHYIEGELPDPHRGLMEFHWQARIMYTRLLLMKNMIDEHSPEQYDSGDSQVNDYLIKMHSAKLLTKAKVMSHEAVRLEGLFFNEMVKQSESAKGETKTLPFESMNYRADNLSTIFDRIIGLALNLIESAEKEPYPEHVVNGCKNLIERATEKRDLAQVLSTEVAALQLEWTYRLLTPGDNLKIVGRLEQLEEELLLYTKTVHTLHDLLSDYFEYFVNVPVDREIRSVHEE